MIYGTVLMLAVMLGPLVSGFRIVRRSNLADPSDKTLWTNPRSFTSLEVALLVQSAVGTLAAFWITSIFFMDPGAPFQVVQLGAISATGFAGIPIFRKLRTRR